MVASETFVVKFMICKQADMYLCLFDLSCAIDSHVLDACGHQVPLVVRKEETSVELVLIIRFHHALSGREARVSVSC